MKAPKFSRRAHEAIFEYAVLRWESAAVIATTMVLTVLCFLYPVRFQLPEWAWIACLTLGIITECLLIYSSITDKESSERIINVLLKEKLQLKPLSDTILQQQVEKAFEYRLRIEDTIATKQDNALKKYLQETNLHIHKWLQTINDLAVNIDRYKQNQAMFNSDQHQSETRIQQLQQELLSETDEVTKQQLELTITGLQRQLASINLLKHTMKRAMLQFEHTLSTLGTIYSQTLLVEVKDVNSGAVQRLHVEIDKETRDLGDLIIALEQVF